MAFRLACRALWLLSLVLVTAAHAGEPPQLGARVIEGVVVAPSGPVGAVEVRATHEEHVVTTVTDAQGHFVLQGLSDAWWTLSASRGAERGEIDVSVFSQDLRDEVLELGPPRRVRGIVRTASGQPLRDARVEAGLQGPYGPVHTNEARTGDDGKFELPVTGFSPVAVQVSAPGHLRRYVANASTTEALDLALEPVQELRGVVLDERGAPVKGVRIRLKRFGRVSYPTSCIGPDPLTATTDDTGAFTIEGLARGRYTFLLQPPPAYSGLSGDVVLPSDAVRWTLPGGVRADVTILSPSGAPAPASVTFIGPLGVPAHASHRTTQADASGRAAMERLLPGDYWVQAELEAGKEKRSFSRRVHVAEGGPAIAMDFRLPHRLRLNVVDARGRPVRGGRLSLMHMQGRRTDFFMSREVHGTATLAGLPEGELSVSVWDVEGYEDAHIKILLPTSAPLRVELKPTRKVSGRVLDARGRPIRAFLVGFEDVTHAGGRFSQPVSFDGEQPTFLRISADGFAPRMFHLEPSRPASLKLGDIRLDTGRTLTGRVESADGRGLAGATLRCRWPHVPAKQQEQACYGESLPGGIIHLAHVPTEPLELQVDHPEGSRTRIQVPAGATEVQVRLTTGHTVRGAVTDGRGLPLETGDVHVEMAGEWHFAPIRRDGTYVIRLPPGSGTIKVLNLEGEPKPFEGAEGQETVVDLVATDGA
jgi:protocatechuate 3,4-dioxygenase beta subunit